MDETKRIALLMGQDMGYCRGVLRGIHSYAIHKKMWVFHDSPLDMRILRPLREWEPHGIIAHVSDQKFARKVLALRKPLINTTSTLKDMNIPFVDVDHQKVGRLAAKHFLDRGFKHFGYFGSAWTAFSKSRERGFDKALAKAGFQVAACYAEYLPRPPLDSSWKDVDLQIRNWLLGLPKPAAVLASNDIPARALAEMCRQLGISVPNDVALLGVDNDELECLLSTPPLSSIVNPGEQIGYQAAKLLDRMMSGHRLPRKAFLVPPTHVVARQSTDMIAVADPDVSAAVAFIRNHALENIGVPEVVENLGISRRGLERRFCQMLGRSVLQEIQRVRVERAKHLLVETNLLMPAVARHSGFSTPQRLAVVFRHVTGQSPIAYRRGARLHP
jgi:LacI family transcriptional regulator